MEAYNKEPFNKESTESTKKCKSKPNGEDIVQKRIKAQDLRRKAEAGRLAAVQNSQTILAFY